jgi:hypothetical protein
VHATLTHTVCSPCAAAIFLDAETEFAPQLKVAMTEITSREMGAARIVKLSPVALAAPTFKDSFQVVHVPHPDFVATDSLIQEKLATTTTRKMVTGAQAHVGLSLIANAWGLLLGASVVEMAIWLCLGSPVTMAINFLVMVVELVVSLNQDAGVCRSTTDRHVLVLQDVEMDCGPRWKVVMILTSPQEMDVHHGVPLNPTVVARPTFYIRLQPVRVPLFVVTVFAVPTRNVMTEMFKKAMVAAKIAKLNQVASVGHPTV